MDRGLVLDPDFGERIAALAGTADLSYCFQCGVCSGSCPTAARMEFGPRRIMHMVHLGLTEPLLRSRDIWLCVSCYSCSSRCPQGVPVADVVSALRNLALERGLATDSEAALSRAFVGVLARHGRQFEAELLLRFFAAERDVRGMLRQMAPGLGILRRGKLPLRPAEIEGRAEVAEIVARLGEKEGA
jgi:heterodisulfide reductase subunit C